MASCGTRPNNATTPYQRPHLIIELSADASARTNLDQNTAYVAATIRPRALPLATDIHSAKRPDATEHRRRRMHTDELTWRHQRRSSRYQDTLHPTPIQQLRTRRADMRQWTKQQPLPLVLTNVRQDSTRRDEINPTNCLFAKVRARGLRGWYSGFVGTAASTSRVRPHPQNTGRVRPYRIWMNGMNVRVMRTWRL